MAMTLSHEDFTGMHPFSRAEVLREAERLGWPRIEYLNFWGRRVPIEGEWAWRCCSLSSAPGRRDALEQLVAIECRRARTGDGDRHIHTEVMT
jgi:hypothetical protein